MTAIAVITLAAAILVLALMRGRSRPAESPAPSSAEGRGLSDGAAAAIEDVAGPMFGVDAHPTAAEALRRRVP